jgi:hypothetical protein
MRRVWDRERKCLSRNTSAGRFKRRLEYQARRARRREDIAGTSRPLADDGFAVVVNSRSTPPAILNCHDTRETPDHDSQTSARARPRAPPAS